MLGIGARTSDSNRGTALAVFFAPMPLYQFVGVRVPLHNGKNQYLNLIGVIEVVMAIVKVLVM